MNRLILLLSQIVIYLLLLFVILLSLFLFILMISFIEIINGILVYYIMLIFPSITVIFLILMYSLVIIILILKSLDYSKNQMLIYQYLTELIVEEQSLVLLCYQNGVLVVVTSGLLVLNKC